MAKDQNGKELPKGITWREDKQTYMARFSYQGKSYTFYDKNLKKLTKKLADERYEVEHGLAGSADKITLDRWYQTWLEDYKIPTIKETSVNTYKQMYSCYIQKELGSKCLKQIKPVHIQKIYNALLERGIAPKTVNIIQAILYNIFEFAVKNDLIVKNPCNGITKPKKEKPKIEALSVDEQNTLLHYLDKEKWKQYKPLIITLLGTGMRIGECLGLTWNDIDFKNKEIHVNKTLVYVKDLATDKCMLKFQSPKTKESKRIIPMLNDVAIALKQQSKNQKRLRIYMGAEWQPLQDFEDMVFTSSKGTPYQESKIRKHLVNIVAEINADEKALAEQQNREPIIMKHIRPHMFRHTFATRCFENDMPPKTVQHILGHSSINLTMDLYTHMSEDKKKEDMKKLEGIFSAVNY